MVFLRKLFSARNAEPLGLVDYRAAGDTHIGRVRSANEDSFLCVMTQWSDIGIVGVADGIGGHEGGEVASYMVMRCFLDGWEKTREQGFHSRADIKRFTYDALQQANRRAFGVNSRLSIRWGMGSTVTIGVIWQNKMLIGHAGDSRCYRVRNGRLGLLTQDQTLMAELMRRRGLSEIEASLHPLANTLTNCIGGREQLRADLKWVDIYPNDRYLFCSDGIYSLVSDDIICASLQNSGTPVECVNRLINLSLNNGGTDNITGVALFT